MVMASLIIDTKAVSDGVDGHYAHTKVNTLGARCDAVRRRKGTVEVFLKSLVSFAFSAINVLRFAPGAFNIANEILLLEQ